MKRLLGYVLLFPLLALVLAPVSAKDDEPKSPKAALQMLNEYIGNWNGSGNPDKPKPDPKDIWKESIELGWKFKGKDSWLILNFNNDKKFKGGEMRYSMEKKVYLLTLLDKQDKKLLFEGELKEPYLTFERTDPDTKELQQIKMNLAGDGARLTFRYGTASSGKKLIAKDYVVGCTKEGFSLGAKEKKNECIVSGGLGTSAVSYKGQTYYVCCSGCRDAFNEDPEKYIKEYEAKKKGKK